MSFRILAWAQSFKAGSPSTKAVLLAIASVVNDDGEGFPSQDRIARDSELSVRTVRRAMEILEEGGILTRERRYRDGGHRTSDAIKVHCLDAALPDTVSADTVSADTVSADTVSNLTGQGVLYRDEPVSEPVSTTNIGARAERSDPRGSRIPDGWLPSPEALAWARSKGHSQDHVQSELEKFCDYWRARAGAGARKADWNAAFRVWLSKSNENDYSRGGNRGQSTHSIKPKSKSAVQIAVETFGRGDGASDYPDGEFPYPR